MKSGSFGVIHTVNLCSDLIGTHSTLADALFASQSKRFATSGVTVEYWAVLVKDITLGLYEEFYLKSKQGDQNVSIAKCMETNNE